MAATRTGRATQAERRAETRQALVSSATKLFAEAGYDAVSVDAVAESAGRTSGAVYDHFGSKQGLLVAVLDEWAHSLSEMVVAEFEDATTLRDRLRAVARNVIVHPTPTSRQLLMLEQELALRAARDESVSDALRQRSAQSRSRLARGFERWFEAGDLPAGASAEDLATLVRALVIGLEIEQRLEPGVIDVEGAAAMLEAALNGMTRNT